MSKVFTDIPIHNLQQVKPESLNKNIDKYLEAFNGTLDGHNFPLESVVTTDFFLPRDSNSLQDTAAGTDVFQRGTSYSTQAYYQTRRSSSFEPTITDVWTPCLTINLDNDSWSKGFNLLTEFTDFEDFPLTFNAIEGQLVGCATIDFEHGTQVFEVVVSDDPPLSGSRSRGFEWWSEWGVFVNNVLVARSGLIFPRRHTVQIPFTVPVGSQQVTIDVRFITVTSRAQGSPTLEVTSSEFNIFSAEIWVRNQIR